MAYIRIAQSGLHTVVETPEFVNGAKSLLTETERASLIVHLAETPLAGDLMQGTGGARKLRWRARGKGKSGGVRVITYYAGRDIPLFVLAIFGKGEKANLTKAERNELRVSLGTVATTYRRGMG